MIDRARGYIPTGLFAVALIVRLGFISMAGSSALALSDDARAYNDLAVNLVERHQFVTAIDPPHRLDIPYATRPPLTPFALAAVYQIVGPHLFAGQFLLACLGALSVVALFLLGKQLFSEGVGIVAGALAAIYPFFVFLSAVPLTENLAILLYTLLALLLTEDHDRQTTRHAVLTGCVLGLAALDRPQVLGFLPFLAVLVLADRRRPLGKRTVWFGVAVTFSAAVVTPWMIRNHLTVGGWSPISLQGGQVLYEGNSSYTETALARLWAGERGWYDDPHWGVELAGLSPLEADRKAFRLAVGFMRDNPMQALRYSVQKVGLFFSAYHHPAAEVSWYPILTLSLLGFFWTAARWRQLLPLYLLILQTTLTAALFTSMPRFRAPVEPLFLLMSAFTLQRLWERRSTVTRLRGTLTRQFSRARS